MTKPVQTNPDWSAWAREQLRLGESSTSADARQAYLKRLSDEDFLPPAHLPYALAVLEGKAKAPGANEEAVWAEVCDRQRQRVEEFARRFFQIPLADRLEQWLKLKAACSGVAALSERLDRLEPALALDPNRLAIADPDVRELIQEASQIFVLRPFEAAQARAAFFRRESVKSEDGLAQLHRAARNLKKTYPQYEVLEPGLIQQALLGPSRAGELSRRRTRPPQSRVTKTQPARVAPTPFLLIPNNRTLRWLLLAAVLIGGAILTALPSTNSHSPPSSGFQSDQYRYLFPEDVLQPMEPMQGDWRTIDTLIKKEEAERLKRLGEKPNGEGEAKSSPVPSRNPPP